MMVVVVMMMMMMGRGGRGHEGANEGEDNQDPLLEAAGGVESE